MRYITYTYNICTRYMGRWECTYVGNSLKEIAWARYRGKRELFPLFRATTISFISIKRKRERVPVDVIIFPYIIFFRNVRIWTKMLNSREKRSRFKSDQEIILIIGIFILDLLSFEL